MKKLFCLLSLVFFLTSFQSVAQTYVVIPDNNFVNWLTSAYPDCMDGNQLNIECNEIVSATNVNVQGYSIADLTGIQYFTALANLNCGYNQLTTLPELPSGLQNLTCSANQLVSLPELPESLLHLDCNGNPNLNTILNLPPNLVHLATGVTAIDLNNYTPLPESLTFLSVQNCSYTSLPELPGNLQYLSCMGNSLSSLPELPESLLQIHCQNNVLTSLPSLPDGMDLIIAYDNQLTELPPLPSALTYLECYDNLLTSLPELPPLLNNLYCQNNQLMSFPEIPQSMLVLNCTNNQIGCFPPFPNTLASPNIQNNPFTCLPNYIQSMGVMGLLDYPLCEDNDLVNNPFGCESAQGVSGFIYEDANGDCMLTSGETGLPNLTIKLIDDQGNFVSSTTSAGNGVYFLSSDTLSYTVKVDTLNKPFQVSCADPGAEQDFDFTIDGQLIADLNFGLECKSGLDIGVQGVVPTGWVFPGQEHSLSIAAGDFSGWYGLQCAEGVSGEVVITVDGPVGFSGTPNNALLPDVVNDNQFTYFVDDFSAVSFTHSFQLLLVTDTTAQAEDLVCVNVSITPSVEDNNSENNTYTSCYSVLNSYDPNMKKVWPQNVEPGFDGYFNYTVYFQNTGNAPAFNIRIADTLDTQLDLTTFEVIGYSHDMLTYLHGNVATFRFNNIMLPDSTTDFDGSIGFVQYRIKPLADLPLGTIIENTAHIFFDFNEAIVTNTTGNEFMILSSVQNMTGGPAMLVFPNPGTGMFTLELETAVLQPVLLEVYNLRGEQLQMFTTMNHRTMLDLTAYPAGMYLVRAQNETGTRHLKVVKQ